MYLANGQWREVDPELPIPKSLSFALTGTQVIEPMLVGSTDSDIRDWQFDWDGGRIYPLEPPSKRAASEPEDAEEDAYADDLTLVRGFSDFLNSLSGL